LGGSKLEQPQRFSVILITAIAIEVHDAQAALCFIKALRCSQPINRNRLGAIMHKSARAGGGWGGGCMLRLNELLLQRKGEEGGGCC
jgi:hypothetical protein